MSDILKAVQVLCEPGHTYELRCPKTEKGTVSGYFDDLSSLAHTADALSGTVPAVYITLNPVLPDLLARANNSHKYRVQHTTQDADIIRRWRLLIDCDPTRPAGISSSEEEHQAALQRVRDIRDYLTTEGFPLPLLGDSSNGGHLVYGIDLPNDADTADLVKRFLESLAGRFDDPVVSVDRSVWNAARISKLYGTLSMKGDPTPARPHRVSRIIETPDRLAAVPLELLRKVANINTKTVMAVASETPTTKISTKTITPGSHRLEDVEKMMAESGLEYRPGENYEGGTRWELVECPWADEHTTGRGGAAVFLRDGVVGFKCQHAHCADRHAPDVFGPVNGKPTTGKFDKFALAFVDHQVRKGEFPLYTGGRIYFYAGNRYVECEELPMKVREFFKAKGCSQSNNVVGNVVPIIQSHAWKDAGKVGPMPFWSGPNSPFQATKNVITFANGIMDMDQPATLIPHSPDWCSTVCLPFAFDPAATCPTWEKFLTEVFEGDNDRVALVQEFFGYCLSQDTSLQKALVLVGKPRSGKGTIQRVLGALVGKDSSTGFSLERLATEFGPSALVNKSVALVGEVELTANPQRTKIVEVLKSIIGEDAISINTKYEAKFPSLRLPTRFVIASNSVPRLMDASGALAHRFLFVPFEISFVGREDIHLEEKLLAELPGIANWALAGLRRLRASGGRFTLGDGHKRLASQYAADTSPIMAWVRSEMVVHRRADPGDLPAQCLTVENVSIPKSDAYELYTAWCEANDIEPTRLAWFGRDLKTLIPKLQEGRDTKADGTRPMVYRGIGVRGSPAPILSGCAAPSGAPWPSVISRNGMAVASLSGQSGHLDCFAQLLKGREKEGGDAEVAENKGNALTAMTPPGQALNNVIVQPHARRLARNLRLDFHHGYVVQPDVHNLSVWRVGKDVEGVVRWLDQAGTRDWAIAEVRRRLRPRTTP